MKKTILASVFAFSFSGLLILFLPHAYAHDSAISQRTPQFTDIARNPDGSTQNMHWWEADAYCKKKGLRLPTAREFAIYAESLGAKGISKTLIDSSGAVYDGLVGLDDTFFYSDSGYLPPLGDIGTQLWFWSSTLQPGATFAYAFHGNNGDFISDPINASSGMIGSFVDSVVCAIKPQKSGNSDK